MSTSKDEKETTLDTLLKTVSWEDKLKKTTNETFYKLYKDEKRYLVLMGGAGSGKSIFAGRKILERIESEKNHRVLVVRKIARTLRESCFSQLTGQINDYYDKASFSINKTDMTITHKNGNRILFAGLDDADKLKSIYNITMIWIEEASEISFSDFNQLDIRLRGLTDQYKQIIISFNPISVNHWLKKRFFDTTDNNATLHKSTYRDNRFLDEQAKIVLEGYKQSDPYYYRVYCLGQWGVYGKSVFDTRAISIRLNKAPKPKQRGVFEYLYDGSVISGVRFSKQNDGFIQIFDNPRRDVSYVIGADTASEGSDYCAAQVIEAHSQKQVAVLHARLDEDIMARQLYCLGTFYNEALLAVEANFSSYPIKEALRLGYTNQYVREVFDTFYKKTFHSFGFKTTQITRPVILSNLISFVREQTDMINDCDTLNEMLCFVRNDNGRAQAANNAHDDLVMSLAIALYVKDQVYLQKKPSYEKKTYNFSFEKPLSDPLGAGEPIEII